MENKLLIWNSTNLHIWIILNSDPFSLAYIDRTPTHAKDKLQLLTILLNKLIGAQLQSQELKIKEVADLVGLFLFVGLWKDYMPFKLVILPVFHPSSWSIVQEEVIKTKAVMEEIWPTDSGM